MATAPSKSKHEMLYFPLHIPNKARTRRKKKFGAKLALRRYRCVLFPRCELSFSEMHFGEIEELPFSAVSSDFITHSGIIINDAIMPLLPISVGSCG